MKLRLFLLAFVLFLVSGCGTADTASDSPESIAGAGARQSGEQKNAVNTASAQETTQKDNSTGPAKSDISFVYTDLGENKCKTVDLNEAEEWSVQNCPGISGYSLNVSEGDLRQTIDVIDQKGKKHKLDMWGVVSSGFSNVGDKAEWRVRKESGNTVPIALIVRYNVNSDPDDSEKITSYLTVTKITPDKICITDIVKPIKNANEKARVLADKSAEKPCIKA